MVSPTSKLRTVRANKKKSQGRKRKNELAKNGTTKSAEELFKVVEE